MRYRALSMMDTPPRIQEIVERVGVGSDPEEILAATLAELDEDALQHFTDPESQGSILRGTCAVLGGFQRETGRCRVEGGVGRDEDGSSTALLRDLGTA